jgi:hypothetical protein
MVADRSPRCDDPAGRDAFLRLVHALSNALAFWTARLLILRSCAALRGSVADELSRRSTWRTMTWSLSMAESRRSPISALVG